MKRYAALITLLTSLLFQPSGFAGDLEAYNFLKEGQEAYRAKNFDEVHRLSALSLQNIQTHTELKFYIFQINGFSYLFQKQYDKAEPLLKQALALAPPNSEEARDIQQNLGAIYNAQSRYLDGIKAYEAVLKFDEAAPNRSADIGKDCISLAGFYFHLKNPQTSKQLLLRGIQVLEANQTHSDHPSLVFANSLLSIFNEKNILVSITDTHIKENYELGKLKFSQGSKDESLKAFQAALQESTDYLGVDHHNTQVLQAEIDKVTKLDSNTQYHEALDNRTIRWNDDTKVIKVYIKDGQGIPNWYPEYTELVKKAFASWEEVLDHKIKIEYLTKPKHYDVLVYWHEGFLDVPQLKTPNIYGVNIKRLWDKYILQNDIEIAVVPGLESNRDRLYSTILHETGHLMGIVGHSSNPTDVMFPYSEQNWKPIVELSERDKKTMLAVYEKTPLFTNIASVHLSDFEKYRRQNLVQYAEAPIISMDGGGDPNDVMRAINEFNARQRQTLRPATGMDRALFVPVPGWGFR